MTTEVSADFFALHPAPYSADVFWTRISVQKGTLYAAVIEMLFSARMLLLLATLSILLELAHSTEHGSHQIGEHGQNLLETLSAA